MRNFTRSLSMLLIALLLGLPLAGQALAGGHGQPQPPRKAILLVTFGTSIPSAQTVFGRVDQEFKKTFPGVEIRWAYTSRIIRDKVAKTQGKTWLSPAEALARLMADGYNRVVVQSLHVIPGEEYHDLVAVVMGFARMKHGYQFVLGYPLCSTTDDLKAVGNILAAAADQGEAVVYMGHGTAHPAGVVYPAMAYVLRQKNPRVFMGTVEGYPTLDDVVAGLKARKITKVKLLPFMTVAGDHATNDMAGREPDSWLNVLKKNGIRAQPVLKAITEQAAIVNIYLQHAKTAYQHLH